MKNKRWLIWLLTAVFLLAACGNSGETGDGQTAVSPPPAAATTDDTTVADEEIVQPDLPDLAGVSDADKAIWIVSAQTAVADFLDAHPNWTAESWQDDESGSIWSVEFYDDVTDDWLGWGEVNVESGQILDYYVPLELSPEAFQAGLEQVEKMVLNDAEVQARLGDIESWERETEYDPQDDVWLVSFWQGLDALTAVVYLDEDGVYLEEIVDPNQLDAEQQAAYNRDLAVELSWEADGIDQALDGVDNWETLVAPQGGYWAVSYVADDEELFFVLVDIENQRIIDN